MPPFGRDFFGRLFTEFPRLEEAALFLRWSSQPRGRLASRGTVWILARCGTRKR
jgi:hypothetical protein